MLETKELVVQFEHFLADEPTGSLDHMAADQVLDLMREVNREDKATFLICTHDEHVAARCTRRITLKDGRVSSERGEPHAEGM
jgi:lipoprotein-releasing system ATP-binding protein